MISGRLHLVEESFDDVCKLLEMTLGNGGGWGAKKSWTEPMRL